LQESEDFCTSGKNENLTNRYEIKIRLFPPIWKWLLAVLTKRQQKPARASNRNVCFAKTSSGKVRSEAYACIYIGYSTNGQDVESSDAVVLPQLLQQIGVQSSTARNSQTQPASGPNNGRGKKHDKNINKYRLKEKLKQNEVKKGIRRERK
jgi:hypothetical protein